MIFKVDIIQIQQQSTKMLQSLLINVVNVDAIAISTACYDLDLTSRI